MYVVCARKRGRGSLGQTDVAHLSLSNQIGEHTHRILDRHIGIDPVLVIEVDRRHAEALQAAFHGSSHILRTAIEAAHERIPGVAQDAKLCREEDIVSPTFDGASDKFFVGVRTVDVGGVEKVDAKLKRAMDRGNRFGVVSPCIKIAHPHAAEAKSRYLRTITAQLSCLH